MVTLPTAFPLSPSSPPLTGFTITSTSSFLPGLHQDRHRLPCWMKVFWGDNTYLCSLCVFRPSSSSFELWDPAAMSARDLGEQGGDNDPHEKCKYQCIWKAERRKRGDARMVRGEGDKRQSLALLSPAVAHRDQVPFHTFENTQWKKALQIQPEMSRCIISGKHIWKHRLEKN